MLKAVSGVWGRFWKEMVSWPVVGSGVTVPASLRWKREAVGDQEDAISIARQWLAKVDVAG